MKISRQPVGWDQEKQWLCQATKGKGWKAHILKIAAAETLYAIWTMRNEVVFNNGLPNSLLDKQIIQIVIVRCMMFNKLVSPCQRLMNS